MELFAAQGNQKLNAMRICVASFYLSKDCFPVMRFFLRTFTYACLIRVNGRVYVF